jgi:2-oxoglutarate dehydrogenase E1 component
MSAAPKQAPSAINAWSADYMDAQFEQFKQDPSSVSPDMAQFFRGFELALASGKASEPTGAPAGDGSANQANLMRAYRELGHLCSMIDPFGRERPRPPQLDPKFHGFSEADLHGPFNRPLAGELRPDLTLRDAIAIMEKTYCGSIGIETGHVSSVEERNWLREYVEACQSDPKLSKGEKAHTLFQLHRAELFEKFCGKRYPGVKRFSLEGGESLIPMLDQIIERGADEYSVEEFTTAMSHRGRLNVLINIMGKTYEQVFTEFEDAWTEDAADGGGDVKYHRGYSSNRVLPSGKHVWLAMASNPSHLEAVDAVILGRTRAKQRFKGDNERSKVVPIIMHGDAAFIGQGVVAETFNLAHLEGYTVGGTIHIAVNNLIGFTTGQDDARSSRYCTDMAKLIDAPVLHVNG